MDAVKVGYIELNCDAIGFRLTVADVLAERVSESDAEPDRVAGGNALGLRHLELVVDAVSNDNTDPNAVTLANGLQ